MERGDQGAMPYVGAAIVVIVILAITVQATVGWSEVGAAWVQAAGSVLALAVAIWVPVHLREADREATKDLIIDRASIAAVGALSRVSSFTFLLDFVISRTERWQEEGHPLHAKVVDKLFNSSEMPTERDVEAVIPFGRQVAALMAMVVGDANLFRTVNETMKSLDEGDLQKPLWITYLDTARDAHRRASTMSQALHMYAQVSTFPPDSER